MLFRKSRPALITPILCLIFTATASAGPARPQAGGSGVSLTEEQALKGIRALTDDFIQKGAFSGTVLVAKGDDILLTAAGGEADKGAHTKINLDTKFNLGSMNKMFTSVAAARLVEAGRLNWDDRLSRFLDETWLPKSVTETITIRHLITHTSGLGSYFNEAYFRSSRELFRRLDDYKPLIRDEKPAFRPGARFQYSNTGMFLLGVVIERITGGDYFDHIRQTITGPAGMSSTECYEMDTPVENLAIGYIADPSSPSGWRNNLYKHVIKGGPAGGGFSTVKDLHRFALALLSDQYVSKETRELMWTDFAGANYGYGFQVSTGPAGRIVGHSGGFPGINARLEIFRDSGFIVALMSNYDNGIQVADGIKRILARTEK
ncbi:MAG: beta-lactamase family protein [Candidatus Aminicenantes bacterium]|nr:beta-lactamase family protein [Candidatus Aminicenantes bacterium]